MPNPTNQQDMKSSLFTTKGAFNESALPVVLSDNDKRFILNTSWGEWAAMVLATLAQVNFGGNVMVFKTVIPTLDTSIYAAGDVLFDTTAIAGAVRVSGGSAILRSLSLIDKDDQAAAQIDLVFFSANVSLGTFNVAPSISDANAAKILAIVPVPAANFIDVGGSKVATVPGLDVRLTPDTGTTIYVAAIARGTPTQTAAGIVINLQLQQE